jgi:hypothetical protein
VGWGGGTLRLEPFSIWSCRLWNREAWGPRSLYRLGSRPFEWSLDFILLNFFRGENLVLYFFRGPALEKITNNNI